MTRTGNYKGRSAPPEIPAVLPDRETSDWYGPEEREARFNATLLRSITPKGGRSSTG